MKPLLAWFVVMVAPLPCIVEDTHAAIGSFEGDKLCDWDTHSVVLARVLETGIDKKSKVAPNYVVLDVTLTLAGNFDCVREAPRRFALPLGFFASPVLNPPPAGSLIIALICVMPDGEYLVDGSYSSFMPEDLPFHEVDGIHDPRTMKTVLEVGQRRRRAESLAENREYDCVYWSLRPPFPSGYRRPAIPGYLWETHSLVYAQVMAKTLKENKKAATLKLRLIGTLAGPLDPALVGEMSLDVEESEGSLGTTRLSDIQDTVFVSLAIEDGKYVLHKPKGEPPVSEAPLFRCDKPTDDHCAKVLARLRESFAKRHPQTPKKD